MTKTNFVVIERKLWTHSTLSKADCFASRTSATKDARGLAIRSFHAFGRSCFSLLTLVLFMHAFTGGVGLPNEALKETDQAQGHAKNRSECPFPNRKRPSASLVESGGSDAGTNQRGKATADSSSISVEEDGGGCDEDESKPSLVTGGAARKGSHPDQEVVPEQATTLGEIRCGWTQVKLEPDCQAPTPRCKDSVTQNEDGIRRWLHVRRVKNQERLF
jgi:hypothetical protein